MNAEEPTEAATYKAMLAAVEALVREVADPDLDLDAMVGKVEAGYGLIKKMRARLDETKQKVEELRLEIE
jgi:exodeoxyribonuclease VII small subunit